MSSDSQTYSICTQNSIKIGQAVLEEFNYKQRDSRILYIRFTIHRVINVYTVFVDFIVEEIRLYIKEKMSF